MTDDYDPASEGHWDDADEPCEGVEIECPHCDGDGWVAVQSDDARVLMAKCPECLGKGVVW